MAEERRQLEFTETMAGYAAAGQTDFRGGYDAGRAAGTPIEFTITVKVDDVDRFIDDPQHEAAVEGSVSSPLLGGTLRVIGGRFNLFVPSEGDRNRRLMRYRLPVGGNGKAEYTLVGFKDLHDDLGPDVWQDTTTLMVNVYKGSADQAQESSAPLAAVGIMRIELPAFLKQLASFRTAASSMRARGEALARFGRFFLGGLWDVYGIGAFGPRRAPFRREIPLYTTEGVKNAQITHHAYSTADRLGLSLLRFKRAPARDVVMIVHGLTTSSDMFIMPEHCNLVSYLLDQGWGDVWTLDYRMSNRFSYNLQRHRFTMDDIALFDYPPALALIREHVGPEARIHVICHCLGAVSFLMSLFGRASRGVASVVANSVGLTPRVPMWSKLKLIFAPSVVEYILNQPYLNPRWSEEAGLTVAKVFTTVNSLFHRECDVPACHMLSLMWGTGWPALYNHRNLADVTHRRGGDLYGPSGVHYYRHVRRMVLSGNTAVKYNPRDERLRALPDNYFQHVKDVQTPVLLMTGQDNRVFTDSNIECHRRLEAIVPGRHSLKVIPGYGHQDVFMGQNVHRDVFPSILEHLNRHAGRA